MSEQARRYQQQITGAPRDRVYLVEKDGVRGDFDGFNPHEGSRGILLEAKAHGYLKFFDESGVKKDFYQGLRALVSKAKTQSFVADGIPVRWHMAESGMVPILRRIFQEEGITGIEVVYTPLLP